MDSLITAAARALAPGDPSAHRSGRATTRLPLRFEASRWRSSAISFRRSSPAKCGARIAYCKALALEPNRARRRWLERKVGAARHPLRAFTGEEGLALFDLANAESGPVGTASPAEDQLQPRRRMEGTHQQVHRDHSGQQ